MVPDQLCRSLSIVTSPDADRGHGVCIWGLCVCVCVWLNVTVSRRWLTGYRGTFFGKAHTCISLTLTAVYFLTSFLSSPQHSSPSLTAIQHVSNTVLRLHPARLDSPDSSFLEGVWVLQLLGTLLPSGSPTSVNYDRIAQAQQVIHPLLPLPHGHPHIHGDRYYLLTLLPASSRCCSLCHLCHDGPVNHLWSTADHQLARRSHLSRRQKRGSER